MTILKFQATSSQWLEQAAETDAYRSCLEGLYVLAADGTLARFDADGALNPEPGLSAGLSSRVEAVLSQYRSGAAGELGLGLIVDTGGERRWDAGMLVLGDRALNELFDAGRAPGTPPTAYERRNRNKTVFRGMELLLTRQKALQPLSPRFCPVLFAPEVNRAALVERYQADFPGDAAVFEVLDLAAPFAANSRVPEELPAMVRRMRHAQTEAARTFPPGARVHAGTELLPVREPGPAAADAGAACFSEGDPVTGWLLEGYSPFNELTDMQRDIVAGYETVRRVEAGSRLIERGTRDDKCIYLVEGVLSLGAPDGETIRVAAGTHRARLPISVLTPHAYDVVADTPAGIIVFGQKLVRRIIDTTRTYTSVERAAGCSTAAISNGLLATYFSRDYLPDPGKFDDD